MTTENNDGPASPPEGWQAVVTATDDDLGEKLACLERIAGLRGPVIAETLTDERPYAVQVQMRKARERGDWAEYGRLARTNEPRRYER